MAFAFLEGMVEDDRRSAAKRLKRKPPQQTYPQTAAKFFGSLVLAIVLAAVPLSSDCGLALEGGLALFILVFAAGLWATEAVPAFAVALLVIGLAILLLGGLWPSANSDLNLSWERYPATWGSPLIWLFFGGFILAQAAEKTGLDRWFAHLIVTRAGKRPSRLLAGCMATTFLFSMFVSNTAATIMMVAVALPIVRAFHHADRFRTGLMLGIAVAANLGGMATLIGSPPNAIAAGALMNLKRTSRTEVNVAQSNSAVGAIAGTNAAESGAAESGSNNEPATPAPRIDFLLWMAIAAPPAILSVILAWIYLNYRYHSWSTFVDLSSVDSSVAPTLLPPWKISLVMVIFSATVLLWMTEGLHGLPVTVVSFLPICAFTVMGILNADDIRQLRWDVLLLIAGGLSLGVAVTDTKLAEWLVGLVPLQAMGPLGLAMCLALLTTLVSNFMSNTAAATILVPIAVVAAVGNEMQVVIPLALGASAAMALPVSTPPNAVVFSTEQVRTPEMVEAGILIGIVTPIIGTLWANFIVPYVA